MAVSKGIADVLAYRFGDEATAPLLAAAKAPATFAFRVAVLKVALLRPELRAKTAVAEVLVPMVSVPHTGVLRATVRSRFWGRTATCGSSAKIAPALVPIFTA